MLERDVKSSAARAFMLERDIKSSADRAFMLEREALPSNCPLPNNSRCGYLSLAPDSCSSTRLRISSCRCR